MLAGTPTSATDANISNSDPPKGGTLAPVSASPATIGPALNDSLPITLLSQTDVLPYMS